MAISPPTLAAIHIDASTSGVQCDGLTDNADRFDEISRLAGKGALIYFPPSTLPCLTSRPFDVPSDTTIWAAPGSVVFSPTANNINSSMLLAIHERRNIRVFGITLDGREDKLNAKKSLAIVYKSDRVVFDHVAFRNSQGIAAVFSTNVTRSGVIDSLVKNVGNRFRTSHATSDQLQGIDFCCGNKADNSANFVRGTHFEDIGLDGLAASDQTAFSAENNSFRNVGGRWQVGGAGIWASKIDGLVLAANDAEDSKGNGFDLSFLNKSTITNNVVTRSGGGGIEISSASNVIVSYNVTDDNWQSSHLRDAEPSQHRGGITLDVTPNLMSNIVLLNNTATNTKGNLTQQFGLQIRGPRTIVGLNILGDNHFEGNAIQAVGLTNPPTSAR